MKITQKNRVGTGALASALTVYSAWLLWTNSAANDFFQAWAYVGLVAGLATLALTCFFALRERRNSKQ